MGKFSSGAVSMTRFRIAESVTRELLNEVPQRLKQFAFLLIDDIAEERGWGWANIDDMLDTEWKASPPEKGEFFAFTLRVDRRRIPSAIMKKEVTIALREEEERAKEQGRKFVSRDRKNELRAQVKLRLLTRTMPVPASFEVVWNTNTGIVYFTSTSARVVQLFMNQFTLSFGLQLEPLSAYALADRLFDFEANPSLERALDGMVPTAFVAGGI